MEDSDGGRLLRYIERLEKCVNEKGCFVSGRFKRI